MRPVNLIMDMHALNKALKYILKGFKFKCFVPYISYNSPSKWDMGASLKKSVKGTGNIFVVACFNKR